MQFANIVFALSLLASNAVAHVQLTHSELLQQFFKNYDNVWPNEPDKLAYVFWSSYADDDNGEVTQVVLDDQISLNPTKIPDESSISALHDWLSKSGFDSNLDYHQTLVDYSTGNDSSSPEEVEQLVSSCNVDDALLLAARKVSRLTKRACASQGCQSLANCFASGGQKCFCRQSGGSKRCGGGV